MTSLNNRLLLSAGIGLGALWALQACTRKTRSFSFAGKVVLVTGGSRGLGLVLARQLVGGGGQGGHLRPH